MISVVGALSRDTLLNTLGLRAVYSGLTTPIGVVLVSCKEIDLEIVKKKVIDGFLVLSSDGNVVYFGRSGMTGNVPLWARTCVKMSDELGLIDLGESCDLSTVCKLKVKEIETMVSHNDIVSLSTGFNSFRGSRKVWPGTVAASMPGELWGVVASWKVSGTKPEPPILVMTPGKVTVKIGCSGDDESIVKMRERRKILCETPAMWVWEDLQD